MSKNWSDEQQAIFAWFSSGRGNLVIRARAGTGKTTTILEAILHAGEAKILSAAFNKKIAVELQERLGGRSRTARAEAKTLHGLGYKFISYAWGRDSFSVDDQVEEARAVEACGAQTPEVVIGIVKELAGMAKNAAPLATVAQLLKMAEDKDLDLSFEDEERGYDLAYVAARAHAVLQASKVRREDGRISFDDMLFIPVACGLVRPWFNMVVIDEAQDMNYTQLLLAQRCCKRGGRIVVVGDDRQAIYGFRGADAGSLDRLKRELRAVEMGLKTTYRCARAIVAEAQKLVPDYQWAPGAPEGTVDSIGYDQLALQARPGDFVLSRKNAPLMSICLRFLRAGVPARVEGRDIGKELARRIEKVKGRSVPDFLKRITAWRDREAKRIVAKGKDVEAKLQVVADQFETMAALADGAANVQEILQRCVDLFEDATSIVRDARTGEEHVVRNAKPAVVCSSIHKSKGLEADRVFILADTLWKKPDAEEDNVKYVAITRAKSHLTWVVEAKEKAAA